MTLKVGRLLLLAGLSLIVILFIRLIRVWVVFRVLVLLVFSGIVRLVLFGVINCRTLRLGLTRRIIAVIVRKVVRRFLVSRILTMINKWARYG